MGNYPIFTTADCPYNRIKNQYRNRFRVLSVKRLRNVESFVKQRSVYWILRDELSNITSAEARWRRKEVCTRDLLHKKFLKAECILMLKDLFEVAGCTNNQLLTSVTDVNQQKRWNKKVNNVVLLSLLCNNKRQKWLKTGKYKVFQTQWYFAVIKKLLTF